MIKENTVKEKAFEAWCKSGLYYIGVAIDRKANKIVVDLADKDTGEILRHFYPERGNTKLDVIGYYDRYAKEEWVIGDLRDYLKELNLYETRRR